uniref:Uncharacterized protein n=1 Tax=Arion vulgaris TaxID=1028688 RepID=A0A0B7A035_9EUPU
MSLIQLCFCDFLLVLYRTGTPEKFFAPLESTGNIHANEGSKILGIIPTPFQPHR